MFAQKQPGHAPTVKLTKSSLYWVSKPLVFIVDKTTEKVATDYVQKSREKVGISVTFVSITALYSHLGAAFLCHLCTISPIPNLMLTFMLKYSHRNREP